MEVRQLRPQLEPCNDKSQDKAGSVVTVQLPGKTPRCEIKDTSIETMLSAACISQRGKWKPKPIEQTGSVCLKHPQEKKTVAVGCTPLGGEVQNTSNPSHDYRPFPGSPSSTPPPPLRQALLGFSFQTLFHSDEMTEWARRYVCCRRTRPHVLALSCSGYALAMFSL